MKASASLLRMNARRSAPVLWPARDERPVSLVRALGQLDAMAEVAAVDVEPPERVQEARDPGFVADPLGQRQAFVERRQRRVVSAGFVAGCALIPEAPEQRG